MHPGGDASLPDAPEHVLLLHGMGCGPWVWDEVSAALPPHLVAVAAPIAGHHGGSRLRHDTGQRAAEQMLDDLELRLDALGAGRVHVVGNSLGGWLALRLAERGRALSVLCLAPAGGWRPGSLGERLVVSRFVLGHRLASRLARSPRLLRSPKVRGAVMAQVVDRPSTVGYDEALRFVTGLADCQALRSAIAFPEARRLGTVRHSPVPTTIAWSGEDKVLSGRWAREGFAHLPVEQLVVPGVGHLPMLDDPGAVARLIVARVSGPAVRAG